MSHIKNEIMGRNLLIVFLCLLAACPMLMAPFGAGVPELALLLIIGMQVLCGWLFARIARVVGKSFGLYFVLGIFPIINFIALILLGNKPTISDEKYREERRKREGEEASRNRATEEAKVTQRPAEDSWQQRAQAEDIPQHVKETEGQRDPQKEPRLKRFALISCIVALLVFLIQTLLLYLWKAGMINKEMYGFLTSLMIIANLVGIIFALVSLRKGLARRWVAVIGITLNIISVPLSALLFG